MKTLVLLLISSMVLFSCSTSTLEKRKQRNALINEHMSQPKTYIGGEFEERFKASGNDGIHVRSIGISVYPAGSSEELAKSKARSNAKFSLITSAPTEFKSMVQQAIGNSLGYTGEYNKIETSVLEVTALRGIEINERDVVCKETSKPNVNLDFDRALECRAVAKVSLVDLKKAYDFTMESKYGIKEKSVVQKILNEQLNSKVNGNRSTSSVRRKQVQPVQQSKPGKVARQSKKAPVSGVRK